MPNIKPITRKEERIHAFMLVFQLSFHNEIDLDETFNSYIEEQGLILAEKNKDFIYKEFEGTYKNIEKIDATIEKNLKDWNMKRLNKVDLSILRLVVYEATLGEIPISVAINEGVALAKLYSSDDGPNFINGVLSSILN